MTLKNSQGCVLICRHAVRAQDPIHFGSDGQLELLHEVSEPDRLPIR
jgi:hypothetical protein